MRPERVERHGGKDSDLADLQASSLESPSLVHNIGMPRLRVLAGSSLDNLTPIEVNSDKPLKISSDNFEGEIAVYIKGFADADGKVGESPYFEQSERSGVTWSFQVQGDFFIHS